MNDVLMKTEGLTRVVGEKAIVDGVSVEVVKGEILAVMGPSGAGKSSFLRLLNRLDEPTGGLVFLDGQDTKEIGPRELRRRVGMVLQTPYLFPGTVGENVAFGPRQRGVEMGPQEISELLERVRLGGYADRDAGRLSGGEAQRVSVARTLANEPEVLLLDEPTSALDAGSKGEVEGLIAEIVRERGIGCVMVTHDPEQARRIAGRVMLMVDGRLERVGATAEVLAATPAGQLGASPGGSKGRA